MHAPRVRGVWNVHSSLPARIELEEEDLIRRDVASVQASTQQGRSPREAEDGPEDVPASPDLVHERARPPARIGIDEAEVGRLSPQRFALGVDLDERREREGGLGLGIQSCAAEFEEPAVDGVVVGDPLEVCGGGARREAPVVVGCPPDIGLVPDVDHPVVAGGEVAADVLSVVRGSVVRDDELEVGLRLGEHRRDRLCDIPGAVVDREAHADPGRRAGSPSYGIPRAAQRRSPSAHGRSVMRAPTSCRGQSMPV